MSPELHTATFKWIVGWMLALVLLAVLNQTRLGHVMIYYSLILMIVLVTVIEAPAIAGYIGSVGKPAPN